MARHALRGSGHALARLGSRGVGNRAGAAELDRTDAALRCGQHAELLADLSTRATQQPFNERIAGQLMIALAGTGRQAEALTAYQHTRQVLVDELGLEPGPELRHRHERVLAGDA